MSEPKLKPDLPFRSLRELHEEANNLPMEPYEDGRNPDDVVVLVIDRASVEFEDEEPCALDYERIRIKPNPRILAVASLERDGTVRNAQRRLADFPQRL